MVDYEKPLHEIVEGLPNSSMTTRMLGALDYLVPGEWSNITNFEEMVKAVTGEEDQSIIQKVGEHALVLYADPNNGYQRANHLYTLVDSASTMAGITAMAGKLAEDVSWLNFLGSVTPKPETTQAIDAGLKLVVEMTNFCITNGLPGDGVGDFIAALGQAAKEDKMRLASWIAFDCFLPLGPEFMITIGDGISNAVDRLEQSDLYQRVRGMLPGSSVAEHQALMKSNLDGASSFIGDFVSQNSLSREGIFASIRPYLESAEERMDYAAAIIDMSTNVFEHTGAQSVARRVIQRAYGEI